MPVLAVHVLRFTMTVVKSMVVVSQAAQWDVTAIDIWKYGTMYFHSLTMMDMVIIQILSRRTLILVWVLKDLQ